MDIREARNGRDEMNELTALIDKTADDILDEWTAEAVTAGIDADSYIGDKLDELEDTEPAVCMSVSRRHLMRVMGVTA